MARDPRDLSGGNPAVVVTNPDVDASPAAFAQFIADVLAVEPELDSIGAAEAGRELRDET